VFVFFGKRILAKNLFIKCLWNWLQLYKTLPELQNFQGNIICGYISSIILTTVLLIIDYNAKLQVTISPITFNGNWLKNLDHFTTSSLKIELVYNWTFGSQFCENQQDIWQLMLNSDYTSRLIRLPLSECGQRGRGGKVWWYYVKLRYRVYNFRFGSLKKLYQSGCCLIL